MRDTAYRLLSGQTIASPPLGFRVAEKLGVDRPRRNRVNGDIMFCHFISERTDEADDSSLSCCVVSHFAMNDRKEYLVCPLWSDQFERDTVLVSLPSRNDSPVVFFALARLPFLLTTKDTPGTFGPYQKHSFLYPMPLQRSHKLA